MSLRLYNTLTKSTDAFRAISPTGEVTFYSCGPTVYDDAHIGNFRSFLNADVLRRTLELHGFRVKHVMNITDVGHMTDDDVAKYQKEAVVGHRPTWNMGVNRGGKGHREEGVEPDAFVDPMGIFRNRTPGGADTQPRRPRYGLAATKALNTLGLDETADAETIKARYKDWVKKLHPDANGGDRSYEDRLREVINAYNTLKAAGLA
jgi:cysteinyl-tRNA synthetase